jgi:hypothetical protein
LIAAVALVLVAVGATVVVLNRGGSPPLGLRATDVTRHAVTLTWRPPAEGVPDGYRIERDGMDIGTVAEGATRFRDTGLEPGITYEYAVVALVEGEPSDPATVSVRTDVPPANAATLAGTYRVRLSITAAEGWESLGIGDGRRATWVASRGGTHVRGTSWGGSWTMTLAPDDGWMTGTTTASLSECSFVPVTDTLTLRVHATAGRMIDGAWRATRFSGTLTEVAPATSVGLTSCDGSSFTARVEATRTADRGGEGS